MEAAAVIGMNYGDEGKGHITNYLSDANTLNVRFNGGGQAAHAVFMDDGRSHIFHHIGSGSLRGSRTLLARQFIVNPLIFVMELYELSAKVPMREIFVDPRCLVTTPYDIAVNEFNALHKNKNDTVGKGINETVERSVFNQMRLTMRDFAEMTEIELTKILTRIKMDYMPHRVKELGLPEDKFNKWFKHLIPDKGAELESFIKIRQLLMDKVVVVWPDSSLIDAFLEKDPNRKLVFEGAQGMLLDQNRKHLMPYLTRSNTGLQNVLGILQTVRTAIELQVYLVTRTYLTRHGDGPVTNKVSMPYKGISNETNPENPFQGSMRYGYLNLGWYNEALRETRELLNDASPGCITRSNVGVALTCLDQVLGEQFKIAESPDGPVITADVRELPSVELVSHGPKQNSIKGDFDS